MFVFNGMLLSAKFLQKLSKNFQKTEKFPENSPKIKKKNEKFISQMILQLVPLNLLRHFQKKISSLNKRA